MRLTIWLGGLFLKRRNITVLLIILLCILSFISLFIGVTDIRIQDILGGDTAVTNVIYITLASFIGNLMYRSWNECSRITYAKIMYE